MSSRKEIFKRLYMTYSPSLYVYAKRFVESPEIREDIVCDVFARLWLKGEAFLLKEETALAYLKNSVRNACLNHLRSLRSAENFVVDQIKVPSYAESPEDIYTIDELYSKLYDAISKLSEEERTIFHELFVLEKKGQEVALKLGVSTKTVQRSKKKILDFLKNELSGNLPAIAFLAILSI